jgi:aryl-alcohol dehydrogenase-like predicted oxidoreductase
MTTTATHTAKLSSMLPGRATPEGTANYRERFPRLRDAGHFRRPDQAPGPAELWMSSIGAGTYLGEPDDATDREYTAALATALRSGINVLDTAINYRHQRSERNVGAALRQVIDSGEVKRNEFIVCTKAGYLSFDGTLPADPRAYFQREYFESGVIDTAQLAGGMHCMTPAYLENQIERSRRNLDLETIDIFYIHNPETQLAEVRREVFQQRLRDAFTVLEKQVQVGNIAYYGVATWSAFRLAEGVRDYVSLEEVETVARAVGGDQHHFRFVQLPFNLAMPEAFGLANQRVERQKMSLLAAATKLGIAVVGSATLFQGRLTRGMPDSVRQILGLDSDAGNAIQFSRSAPGLITALIGMAQHEHVTTNMKLASTAPTPAEKWKRLFTDA